MRLSPKSTSEGRTGSGIHSDVAGVTWLAFEANVGDTIVMDLQYRLHTGCIKGFFEAEKYVENGIKTTNSISILCTLKSVTKVKLFQE